jgi:hypothetical protein
MDGLSRYSMSVLLTAYHSILMLVRRWDWSEKVVAAKARLVKLS